MEIEDLVVPRNLVSEFKKRDIKQTLQGLREHRNHNGVQLDGLRQISELCAQSTSFFFKKK
jgi:hypothetical protein